MNRLDQTILQLVAAACILLAAKVHTVENFVGGLFPGAAVAIPAVLFVLFYRLLVWQYWWFLWPILHWRRNLRGHWIYVIEDDAGGHNVYGTFGVKQREDRIRAEDGVHWYCWENPETNRLRGAWQGCFVPCSDDGHSWLLWWMVEVQTARTEDATRGERYLGVAELQIVDRTWGRPRRLGGTFVDFGGRPNRGRMLVERRKISNADELREVGKTLAGAPANGA